MRTRRFIQCDVFAKMPTKGNGLAVVIDAEGLSDTQMQSFAAWTNLAETTFLFPPTGPDTDYKVRIFTPSYEMVFAGHPTLGSCASWLHVGGTPRQKGLVRQECGIGIVEIDISSEIPAFVAPPTTIEALAEEELQTIIEVLNIKTNLIIRTAKLKNGPEWQVLELASAQDVLSVDASGIHASSFDGVSLIGPYPEGSKCHFEVRMFDSTEDPITGSLNSAIACWMYEEGRLKKNLVFAQGTKLNRNGRVYIKPDANETGRILIGGETQILIEGTVKL